MPVAEGCIIFAEIEIERERNPRKVAARRGGKREGEAEEEEMRKRRDFYYTGWRERETEREKGGHVNMLGASRLKGFLPFLGVCVSRCTSSMFRLDLTNGSAEPE